MRLLNLANCYFYLANVVGDLLCEEANWLPAGPAATSIDERCTTPTLATKLIVEGETF
ncbi:4-hydroxy-3-methylbut-2-enyl diphosphate reductase [Moritella viscosa]|uniref:4-hydroxy-3-methylbut-2-enyl diphosphate reductase n=1 Tax=Moritella viscosa TaxID=80854 RepID=A0ABY1HK26_9GAMM|nr:4-hydroxy-3-methylbut-2-enyl diphosphate reductase [Moritella viscosa]SGZ06624.1 4-hydroxy-3-methylbut-2-enyl diphosphate reductase [Moritella viscosa]SGZ14259.1 4-hydroxy-3-methylbut-2-enyl diphosphate reductase [Moritella viscosa]SHO13773.1 4-hydroxy-3-methylbut-2-enyl diphosphate reductase [Moritella viscosa]SHO15006.1 4-hydroxy-3-methylbut-2-enyl diphosphate reductase [Moritella viscosa]